MHMQMEVFKHKLADPQILLVHFSELANNVLLNSIIQVETLGRFLDIITFL